MYGCRAVGRRIVVYVEGLTMPRMLTTKLKNFMSVSTITTLWLLIGGMSPLLAFTQVTVSTAAPASIEQTFLASTTNQFLSVLKSNPLFPDTYSIQLLGLNPNFVAPSTATCFQLDVSVDTTTLQNSLNSLVASAPQVIADPLAYGFVSGMTYQQNNEQGVVALMANLCGSATNFMLVQTTTATFNKATCQDTLITVANQIFELSLSTPTPLPVVP